MFLYFRKKKIVQIIEDLFSGIDTNFDSVSLLLSGDSHFNDTSLNRNAISNTSTTIDTTTKKFGSGSFNFDGTNSFLSFPNSDLFAFGYGDFTIEFWIFGALTQNQILFDFRNAGSNNHLHVTIGSASTSSTPGGIRYVSNIATMYTTNNIMDSQFHHVAISRYNGTTTIYVDGIAGASSADNFNFTAAGGTVYIGRNSYGGTFFTGKMDEIRITKGIARYRANFSIPTTQFGNGGYELEFDPYWEHTTLLLNTSSSNIVDLTTKNSLIPTNIIGINMIIKLISIV